MNYTPVILLYSCFGFFRLSQVNETTLYSDGGLSPRCFLEQEQVLEML
jgi:hypothetical protein